MITFKQFITEAFKPIPFIEGGNHRYSVIDGNEFKYHIYRSDISVGGLPTRIDTYLFNSAKHWGGSDSRVSFSVNGRDTHPNIKRTHSEAMQIFNTVLGHIGHHMKLVSPESLSFSPSERIHFKGDERVSDEGEGRRKIFQRMADQFGVDVNA